jgi:hypothetical protein
VFVSGQNPPFLTFPTAFTYLPPGTPALPTVDSMTPNTSDEHGGQTMTMTGTNAPISSNYTIIASFLFSSATVHVACIQTVDNAWDVLVPAVPATENYTQGPLLITVRVTFSDQNTPQLLPISVTSAAPNSTTSGNPLRYMHSGTPLSPDPEEYVIMSGLEEIGSAGSVRAMESYVRTIRKYDPALNMQTPYADLQGRYMYNGSYFLAPSGTHHYPSPVQNITTSFREANSIFAHFVLPEFTRTYTPAVAVGVPTPPPVSKPVSGKLFHCTSQESGTSGPSTTGLQDAFFAVYSNGQVDEFDTGKVPVHEEIHIHPQFSQFPYFAVVHDNATPRIFVCRCDGEAWGASGGKTEELILTGVTGIIRHLSLKFCGNYLYFTTNNGNVWRSQVDATSPTATALNWPAGFTHSYISDELAVSGDGTTLAFVAGDGKLRFGNPTQAPPAYSTHNVFAVLSAHQGNGNIIPVTDWAAAGAPRQIMMWDLDSPAGANKTYGSANLVDGGNDRRIFMAGVNPFSSGSNGTNLPGADVILSADGQLCAFVTREDRDFVDGTQPAAVVYYLYVARVGQGTNKMSRINSASGNNFGIGAAFDRDMTIVPGMWFPKKATNAGMNTRLVFTVATVAGAGTAGQNQHVFTADIQLTGTGIGTPIIHNRTDPQAPSPYVINAQTASANYFGAFPSRSGHVLFLINADTAELLFLDLRDGVTTPPQAILRAHDGQAMTLPTVPNPPAAQQNTYLPSGFAPDPAGSVDLEHWANQMRSLPGPGLTAFTSEYLMFVAEENAGEQDVYVLQMNSLTSPLPSDAINITNIAGPGSIKVVTPSLDGSVLAVVKGQGGFIETYRFAGAAAGKLHIVNDVIAAMNANATGLNSSAVAVTTVGNRISRGMGWYEDPTRFSLYFGEGSTVQGGTPSTAKSILRFQRLDLDRTTGNTIGTPVQIVSVGGVGIVEGATYIYGVGKQE